MTELKRVRLQVCSVFILALLVSDYLIHCFVQLLLCSKNIILKIQGLIGLNSFVKYLKECLGCSEKRIAPGTNNTRVNLRSLSQ